MPWIERFNAGWRLDPATGCHLWQRATNSRGYGVIWIEGKLQLAHRVAWYAKHGAWPSDGLVLDHHCDTKSCVNVEHLAEATNRENVLRAPLSPMNVTASRTACGRGHRYTPETLRIDSRGHRQCRLCDAVRGAA